MKNETIKIYGNESFYLKSERFHQDIDRLNTIIQNDCELTLNECFEWFEDCNFFIENFTQWRNKVVEHLKNPDKRIIETENKREINGSPLINNYMNTNNDFPIQDDDIPF